MCTLTVQGLPLASLFLTPSAHLLLLILLSLFLLLMLMLLLLPPCAIYCTCVYRSLDSATKLRKILSMELNPPIQEVIDCGAVPIFVDMLRPGSSDSVHPSIQFESAWALTNIASGTSAHTATVIDSGAIPVFVSLLTLSNNCDVREQAAWALGNIAGDSPRCRDLVLNANALKPLLLQLKKAGSTFQMTTSTSELSMLRNTAWTLSNLCRGKPQPELSQVKPALAPLAELISSTDPEMSADACWALCYLSGASCDLTNTCCALLVLE